MIRNNLLLFRKFARDSLNYFHQIYSNLSKSSNLFLSQSIYLYLLIMIRDNESVKSWTACLLRSTANKRVSLLSFDVSTEAKNIEISWNIKIKEQLRQWVLDQSNEIIKMLNELRDQRDMTLKCNEHWIDLQVDHIKRLDELKIN